eukprot:scaffold43039_cov183-Skeletonema_dohrnii-CCMP3373.AAC.1
MGKTLGNKSTPTSLPFIDPQQQRRRRQQCRNSDKLLVLLAAIACILSITHIYMHSHTLPSHHHDKGNQHPHHKNFMKDALDNFVQKGNTNNKDSWVRKSAAKQQLADENISNDENNKPTVKEFGKNGNISIEPDLHPVAHLNCADHGGPTDPHIIDEMVFWVGVPSSDIPSDADYLSPMHPLNDPYTPDDTERFLTFEPDSAGWNNIRMAMETALVMSHAMGRTLVLPPEKEIWELDEEDNSQKS